jgi:hypothetical protein
MILFSVCRRSILWGTCLQEWTSDKTMAYRPFTMSSRRGSTSDTLGWSRSIRISSWVNSLDTYIQTPSVSSTVTMVRFIVLPHGALTYTYAYIHIYIYIYIRLFCYLLNDGVTILCYIMSNGRIVKERLSIMAVEGAVTYFKASSRLSHRDIVKSRSGLNRFYRQNSSKYYGWILCW